MASAGFFFGAFGGDLSSRRRKAPAEPTPTKCGGHGCENEVTFVDALQCNHVICQKCQILAFLTHQNEARLIQFYLDPANYYGNNTATTRLALGVARPCPYNCEAQPKIDSIPRVPPCPLFVQKMIVWDKIKNRVEIDRRNTGGSAIIGTGNAQQDRRSGLYDMHRPLAFFSISLSESGIRPIGQANAVYMLPEDTIDRTIVFGSNLSKKITLF